jgi:DNA-directed RNA polymerase subunit alpha
MKRITKQEYLEALETIQMYNTQLEQAVMKKTGGTSDILNKSIMDIDFSCRAYNCLKNAGISTVSDLLSFGFNNLLKTRNFGKKTLTEIEEFVTTNNLKFIDQ